ncbi:uncharacterized protein RJT20DRAFT_104274 [Scheffersomyces xylosifermentans]|uniref:uncharacterized protein n=1 Tax=Scheffersomyces xylosifermentans TaxID=1304137 RepID=UPI00315C6AE3
MRLLTLLTVAAVLISETSAAVVSAVETPPPVVLEKRAKEVIINKEYQKQQEAKAAKQAGAVSSSTPPAKWFRTVTRPDTTLVEIVSPTVIAGVTFGAKPPTTTNGLEPWISLKKDGSPQTIKPELKNGHFKKASPTYGTWFATATTVTYNKEQLKAHNMAEDEIFEEVIHIDEDPYEHSLDPLIRCTPDHYAKKGMSKTRTTEPFCFPRDNQRWLKDKTYFVTWFSRFFDEDVENVKIHLFYVQESSHQKGFKKRDFEEEEGNKFMRTDNLTKRSDIIEKGGKTQGLAFYSSDWIKKTKGWEPITVDENWIGPNEWYRKALISIQPDNVSDEDFDHMAYSIVVEVGKGVTVSKGHLEDLKKLDAKYNDPDYEVEEGIDFEKYMIMMSMPTCVAIAALFMYFFVYVNKIDLSHLKKRKFAGKNTKHKKIPFIRKKHDYTSLPQFKEDVAGEKND